MLVLTSLLGLADQTLMHNVCQFSCKDRIEWSPVGGSSVVMLFSNEQEVCFISCWDRCLIAGLDSLLSKQEGEKKIQKCALLEHLVLWHKYLNFLLCLNECWQNMCKPLNPVEGLQMYICRLVFLVKAGWILVIQKRT